MGMFSKIMGGMGGKGGGMMGGGGGQGVGGGGGMMGGGMSPSDNPYTGFGIGGGHFSKAEPPKPRIEERQQAGAAGQMPAGKRIENRQQRAGVKRKAEAAGDTSLNDTQGFSPEMFVQFLQQILSQGGAGQQMGGFEKNFGREGSFSSGYRGGQ